MDYKYIFFDFDGTLVNTVEGTFWWDYRYVWTISKPK